MPTRKKDTNSGLVDKFDLLRLLAPQLPRLVVKSGAHLLSRTPQSKHWDLRSLITVELLRGYLHQPGKEIQTVEEVQAVTKIPQKVAADTWKCDVELTVSERDGEGLYHDVKQAIRELGDDGAEIDVPEVTVENVTAEWVGAKGAKAAKQQRQMRSRSSSISSCSGSLQMTDEENYAGMMKDITMGEDCPTILYLHGGAYFLCDPSLYRPLAQGIAHGIGGRCLVIDYRLSPQTIFPGQLLDALVAYLNLLYPPRGALHSPVSSSKIVFAGDSAGANLAFSLTQLLLHFEHTHTRVRWHGDHVNIPLPAGICGLSPWVDIPRSFGGFGNETLPFKIPGGGSETSCASWDFLPTPRESMKTVYKDSPAWNAEIRRTRKHFYTLDHLQAHCLVSPVISRLWEGCPPVWIAIGDECLRDSVLYLSHRMLEAGVSVRLEYTISMPHVFQAVLQQHKASASSWKSLYSFIGHVVRPPSATNEYKFFQVRIMPSDLKQSKLSETDMSFGLELDQVKAMLYAAVEHYGKDVAVSDGGSVRDGESFIKGGSSIASSL